MAKGNKSQGKTPERRQQHQRAEVPVVVSINKASKTCPEKRKGCSFLGRKDSCSINGSRCNY